MSNDGGEIELIVASFGTNLINGNKYQTDGKNTAWEFERDYLGFMMKTSWWDGPATVTFDFQGVDVLSPSFVANSFAAPVYRGLTTPERYFEKVKFKNISRVKMETIKIEVMDGSSWGRE